MKMVRGLIAVASMALAGAGAAQAAIVTYAFSGTTQISMIAGTAATFSGTFSYDTGGTVLAASSTTVDYLASAKTSFTSGSVTTAADSSAYGFVTVQTGAPSIFRQMVYYDAGQFGYADIRLEDNDGIALGSTALPLTLDLNDFEQHYVYLENANGSGDYFYGIINSLQILAGVPEPSSWAMMLSGFALIGGSLRRQRRASPTLG